MGKSAMDKNLQQIVEHIKVDEPNIIKRFVKKMIVRANEWWFYNFSNQLHDTLVKMYSNLSIVQESQLKLNSKIDNVLIEQQKSLSLDIEKKFDHCLIEINKVSDRLEGLSGKIQEVSEKTDRISNYNELEIESILREMKERKRQLEASARDIIRVKWRLYDYLFENEDRSYNTLLTCKICGYAAQEDEFEIMETSCMFDGGYLKRYICPKCGVIFGPVKFSDLPVQELSDDYTVHYIGHNEGDCSDKELRAFHLLNPNKNGCYLNYGCGNWSSSLKQLHLQGYKVYGYEPYSPDVSNPFMITDKETLRSMKFDGIYSNDLLEHLMDPVEDLRFMKSILKDPSSRMAHSTSCYIYKYEYTRFHTHFFTGKSLDYLSARVGLNLLEYIDDEKDNDFICAIFIPNEKVDYLTWMQIRYSGEKNGKRIVLNPGGIIFGPYIRFWPGLYKFEIEYEGACECEMSITADKGLEHLKEMRLSPGINLFEVKLEEEKFDIEYVIHGQTSDIVVKKLAVVEFEYSK